MTQRVDIIGRGWSFPFRFTAVGRVRNLVGISDASSTERIGMAIRQILGTKVGSRVIDRDFGSDLREVLFTPIDEVSVARVRFAVTSAIQTWEKRVDVLNVDVNVDRVKEGVIEVTVYYKIIATQKVGNLVWPLYIDESMKIIGQIDV